MSQHITPVILSGGTGSRLWPLSRSLYPKQLQALYSERSMLQETLARVAAEAYAKPLIICNHDHRFIVAEQVLELGADVAGIILEPEGRNTAPAATVAAMMVERFNPEGLMLLMPSDHFIGKPKAFAQAVCVGAAAAETGQLVTFGISVAAPETGYGYLHVGDDIGEASGCFKVQRFVEKPDRTKAEAYMASGEYLWNSGIFLFRPGAYLDELKRLQPDIYEACEQAIAEGVKDLDFFRLDAAAFAKAPKNSIDYAVMEHSERVAVVPVDAGWSDLGAWDALWSIGAQDDDGNVLVGDVIAESVSNSYIRSTKGVVAALGVENLIVVATEDAVLVVDKGRAQDVRGIVEQLQKDGRGESESHTRVHRPWGWYQNIDHGEGFKVKRIMVKPGAALSLQSHAQRAEHWVVVSGRAIVTRDHEKLTLERNQSTYIPQGVRHRLENATDMPLHIIEVQSGAYLEEDDIVRYEDNYNRST